MANEEARAGGTARREAEQRARPHARITLIRHGEPDWTPRNGPSVNDPALTAFGAAQARATAKRVDADGIDAIYVSPYRRSQETAAALAEVTGLTPITPSGALPAIYQNTALSDLENSLLVSPILTGLPISGGIYRRDIINHGSPDFVVPP